MIVTCNRIYVNAGYTQSFEARFRDRSRGVEQAPGFVSFHLLRPTSADDPYVVMTFWQSMHAFDAWTKSEAFQQGHGGAQSLPAEAFSRPPQLEIFESV